MHARQPGLCGLPAASKVSPGSHVLLGGRVADAKDVIAVLSLDIGLNDEVIIGADGPDEEEAVSALADALHD